jgi:hypothetical protein
VRKILLAIKLAMLDGLSISKPLARRAGTLAVSAAPCSQWIGHHFGIRAAWCQEIAITFRIGANYQDADGSPFQRRTLTPAASTLMEHPSLPHARRYAI